MRHTRLAIALGAMISVIGNLALAYDIEDQRTYLANSEVSVLRVISTADLDVFDPILQAFSAANPSITVEYIVTGTSDLMQAIEVEGAAFDLAISSAMDLQTKLANDGYAQSYVSPFAQNLPNWAIWRDQVFAFTREPAVLVVSNAFFAPDEVPDNRDDLINLLRENPARFQGKIGTYDVRSSGFGYLMATQDSRNSDAFWRLMEVMGRLDAQLYCCSIDMIRDVANGDLALAYNVLGTYAAAQLRTSEGFEIVELTDYTNVMLRTAIIPGNATNVTGARVMIDFLLSMPNKPALVEASGLPAIDPSAFQDNSALRPIRFGPGLLVFLDQMKRQTFLRNWESSLLQD
jgi:iron(III) transport system substrate-binding protein